MPDLGAGESEDAGVPRRPRADAGVAKLQERDIRVLQMLARYRFCTRGQIEAHAGFSSNNSHRRLMKLRHAGLVDKRRVTGAKFEIWFVTQDGVLLSGLGTLPPKRIPGGTLVHMLGLADIGVAFESDGELVVTEAEIRSADASGLTGSERMQIVSGQGHRHISGQPVFAVAASGASKNKLHIPDLVLAREPVDGRPRALGIELELTVKAPSRVQATLLAYKRSTNLGGVIYYTRQLEVHNLIMRAAKATGTEDIVQVRHWKPSEASGIDPRGTAINQ